MDLIAQLKAKAATLGFNRIGIIDAKPSPTLHAYLDWVAAGMYGEMGYLAREDRLVRRRDLNVILPNVQSLIIVALDYSSLTPPAAILNDPTRGRISNYAWGVDYHSLMTPRLEALAQFLQQQIGTDIQQRVYVDTGAILERSHAHQAGLGFVGKNTMLIHPRFGSHFFLGEILTTVHLPSDLAQNEAPRANMCGTCTRCLKACPTNAFPKPYTLDARRCISYLTIELKNAIPLEMRPLLGNWVYGCDICQEVCPWNRFAVTSLETDFFPADIDHVAPKLADLLSLSPETFKARFSNSPILRIGRDRLVRNACIAAGNSHDKNFIQLLETLLSDNAALVQEHAHWAIQRLSRG